MTELLATDLNIWLRRGLTSVAAAGAVLATAVALWGLLTLLADETGAQVACGVSVAAGVALLGSLAGIVLLLAWDRLATDKS